MPLPADNYIATRNASEAQRLDAQHHYMLSCQGYYLHPSIPIPPNARIADLCTGSAIFINEIASAHPTTSCHGFDISDTMFPQDHPRNVHLHTADIKQPFEPRWLGFFDVVHIRLVMAATRKEEWGPVLRNVLTLLKPGDWLQWVELDTAHSYRHAARAVAPVGAARESLSGVVGESRFRPPRLEWLDRFNRLILPDERADDMTYAYMNLDALMRDPAVGGMRDVGCDTYVVDREDDGGELRRDWAVMTIQSCWTMMKLREEAGEEVPEITRDQLADGFLKDIDAGGYFVTRAAVFFGRKKD